MCVPYPLFGAHAPDRAEEDDEWIIDLSLTGTYATRPAVAYRATG